MLEKNESTIEQSDVCRLKKNLWISWLERKVKTTSSLNLVYPENYLG